MIRVRSAALSLFVTFLVLLSVGADVIMAAGAKPIRFKFEDYEGFLGFGKPDISAARRDFLPMFPVGTQVEQIKAFFEEIGGRCFELPRDFPNQQFCRYTRPKYRWAPFWPVAIRWAATIWFNGESRQMTQITLEVDYDYP